MGQVSVVLTKYNSQGKIVSIVDKTFSNHKDFMDFYNQNKEEGIAYSANVRFYNKKDNPSLTKQLDNLIVNKTNIPYIRINRNNI